MAWLALVVAYFWLFDSRGADCDVGDGGVFLVGFVSAGASLSQFPSRGGGRCSYGDLSRLLYAEFSGFRSIFLPQASPFGRSLQYMEDRPWHVALWFSLAALAKETAVIAPLALVRMADRGSDCPVHELHNLLRHWEDVPNAFHLFIPALPLAVWFAFHRLKTGYVLWQSGFLSLQRGRNAQFPAHSHRVRIAPLAGRRLFRPLPSYAGRRVGNASFSPKRSRSPTPAHCEGSGQQAVLAIVLLAYLTFMSAVGGAALARYLLPVIPLVILVNVATLWRRTRYWKAIAAIVAIAFVAGLFISPPYGFSLEDNLVYRDFTLMHAEASHFLAARYPNAVVLTAWPASDELARPWLVMSASRFAWCALGFYLRANRLGRRAQE